MTLRRQLRSSGQLHRASESTHAPGHIHPVSTDVAAHMETLDDIGLDDYLDCIAQIDTAVTRANARLELMVDKGRQALSAINDVKDGAKGRVLVVLDEDDYTTTVHAESEPLPDG